MSFCSQLRLLQHSSFLFVVSAANVTELELPLFYREPVMVSVQDAGLIMGCTDVGAVIVFFLFIYFLKQAQEEETVSADEETITAAGVCAFRTREEKRKEGEYFISVLFLSQL